MARSVAPRSNAPASDVTNPASNAASTERPSTVPKSNASALHSVGIGASSNRRKVVAPQQLSLIRSLGALIISRVEERRGSLGHAATPRFPSPLIKPDVPISGIRLSDQLHREAHDGGPM